MRRHLALALEITVPIALLVLWGVVSASGDTFYFPPLTEILEKFQELWLFDRVGSDVVPSVTPGSRAPPFLGRPRARHRRRGRCDCPPPFPPRSGDLDEA